MEFLSYSLFTRLILQAVQPILVLTGLWGCDIMKFN